MLLNPPRMEMTRQKVKCSLGDIFILLLMIIFSSIRHLYHLFYTENYKILSLKHHLNNGDGNQFQLNLWKDLAHDNSFLWYTPELIHVKIFSLKVIDQYCWLSSEWRWLTLSNEDFLCILFRFKLLVYNFISDQFKYSRV